MALPKNPTNTGGQTRLINHFSSRSVEDHGSGWSDLWDSNASDLWDRGQPSPALIDIIEQEREVFSPFTADQRRKRALVPGCGRGYDVVMLARHGFEAYGLEISATGVAEAKKYAAAELQKPQACNFGSENYDPTADVGSVMFIEGDFFKSDWESTLLKDGENLT